MTFELKPKRFPRIFDQRIAKEFHDEFPESSEQLNFFFAAVASCSPHLYSQILKEKSYTLLFCDCGKVIWIEFYRFLY